MKVTLNNWEFIYQNSMGNEFYTSSTLIKGKSIAYRFDNDHSEVLLCNCGDCILNASIAHPTEKDLELIKYHIILKRIYG